ncbi:MAG: hypothetical protein V4654_15535 [Bdellovibrionota bacterium]
MKNVMMIFTLLTMSAQVSFAVGADKIKVRFNCEQADKTQDVKIKAQMLEGGLIGKTRLKLTKKLPGHKATTETHILKKAAKTLPNGNVPVARYYSDTLTISINEPNAPKKPRKATLVEANQSPVQMICTPPSK